MPAHASDRQARSQCSQLVFIFLLRPRSRGRFCTESFTEHVLDLQLTRHVSYVPNGFSQVKVLQARANTIFRQDKVRMLSETVRSTIKPIDQPLELVLQRDTD